MASSHEQQEVVATREAFARTRCTAWRLHRGDLRRPRQSLGERQVLRAPASGEGEPGRVFGARIAIDGDARAACRASPVGADVAGMQRILLVLDLDLPPYAVYLRPWAREFLRHVAVHFELAVWTSSSAAYARSLVPVLFDDPSRLAFVWSRERCTLQRDLANDTWFHAKRLAKVKRHGHDLRRTVVVDDSPEKHLRNYGNLVRVAPFLGDPADDELPHLAAWLERLHIEPDVRVVEKRGWRRHVPSPVSFMHAAS